MTAGGLAGQSQASALNHVRIPASFFGIVLGLAGLGNCWRVATQLWGLPAVIGETVMSLTVMVWAILVVLYAGTWLWSRSEAAAEFHHPVLCCFVGLAPVSTALIAIAIRPYEEYGATALAIVGIVGQLVFGVYRTGQLWMGNRDHTATTPILYLPTVAGSFVSAIVLSAFGHPDWAAPFFGAGLLSWLAIESVLLHRLYTVAELPVVLRPTLGIQLAPSVVGCAAYLSLTSGPPDLFAQALLGYGLLQTLVLIRLAPWIAKQAFAASYWAFSFGVTALTLCMLRFVERGAHGPIAEAAPVVFAAANLMIGGLAIGTVWLMLRGKLLPPRVASAAAPSPAT